LALRACLVASDAAFNIKDFLTNSSRMAFLAVRDCEKELDRIERQMDEQLPAAITQVSEPEARELLACLRFSNELERIGDLLWGVGQRVQNLQIKLPKADSEQLIEMIGILEKMLQQVREGFTQRELDPASYGVRADRDCQALDDIGRPIPGLYVAGADVGAVSIEGYVGGLAPSLMTGLRAGINAARNADKTA